MLNAKLTVAPSNATVPTEAGVTTANTTFVSNQSSLVKIAESVFGIQT